MPRVTMPQLGESVAEGTIGKWLKKPGDSVAKYEPLLEVITDKVNAEVPSPYEGILKEILVAPLSRTGIVLGKAIGGTTVVAAGNARLVGAALIAAGGALNFVIVTLNRGMPVDPAAVSMAGGTMPTDRLHVTATSQTILAALSDVIPVTPLHAAYSAGDVAIALGAFLVPFVLLIRR